MFGQPPPFRKLKTRVIDWYMRNLINTNDLAGLLGVGASAILKRIEAGTLPAPTETVKRAGLGRPLYGWRRRDLRKVLRASQNRRTAV